MAKRGRGITLPAQARHSRTRKVGDTLVLAEGFTVDPRQGQRPLAGLRGSVADSSPSRHGDHGGNAMMCRSRQACVGQ